jgi:GT2 family glycosyltransferase
MAVIVPHRDDARRLARCLAALARSDLSRAEVVVVDNASPEPPTAAVEAHPFARLALEPAPGAAMARNRGVAETSAPLLLFLDADCVPAPGWAEAAAAALARPGAADVVGGRVEVFHEGAGEGAPLSGAQAFESVFAFDNRAYVEGKGFSVTANLATRRDVFEAVGPFRAGMSEDLDWCARARARGFRLAYEDGLVVSHPSRADWPALERKWRRLTEEGFGLGGGGARARLAWGARALAMPASVPAHLPRILRAPGLAAPERARGAATLARLRWRRMGWMLRQAATGRP